MFKTQRSLRPKTKPTIKRSGIELWKKAMEQTPIDCTGLNPKEEIEALELSLKSVKFENIMLIEQEFGYKPGKLNHLWKVIHSKRNA